MPERPTAPRPGIATLAIHGARDAHRPGDAVVEPLVQSVNHLQALGTGEGLRYTRYGNTPNADRVQRRIALLEGAERSVLLASGMGATACALFALLRPGDHLVSSRYIYGGTHRLFFEEFARLGIAITLVDPFDPQAIPGALRPETTVIFLESPVNPTCRVLDIRPTAALATARGITLVVDSTFASPVNFRPIAQGAHVVIESATKYLNGHHDVLMGVVSGTNAYIEQVVRKAMLWGPTPDPFAVWLLERGLKTLAVRVERSNASAMAIAAWATSRAEFRRVHYPGLATHPDHAIARATLDGFGGMLGLELAGGGPAAERFLQRLQLVTHAPSLGGVDTLVSEPRYTSHSTMTPAERAAIGIPDGFLRLSIGLEAVEDLIADLAQALA